MTITKHVKEGLVILLSLVLADLLSILHTPLFGIADILWIILLVPVLGSLVLSLFLDTEKFHFEEWLVYCVGVGLATLMLAGLVVNTIGLQINHAVLRRDVMMPVVDVLILGVILIRHKLLSNEPSRRLFPKFVYQKGALLVARTFLPFVLPLLTAFGAIRLNNGAGNSLALVALGAICIYLLALIIFAKKIYLQEVITSLFSISLALALSVSMRSNYLIGFDIHQEFQVFSAAAATGLWHPHLFNDAYNACLSITVLPAMLKALMPISSEYLFKLMMQILFGVMPLIVFVIANNKLRNKRYAYIASLFFIVQGPLIFEFPGLIRQQIGLIFFGLIFASAMSETLSKMAKSILLIVFGIAMVTSHYSTTYVTIALLILLVILRPLFVWVIESLKNFRYSVAKNQSQQSSWYISPIIVLIILLTAFLWYGETLQATGGIAQKITSSISNFGSTFNSDSHSDFVTSTFGLGKYVYSPQTLDQIAQKNSVDNGYRPASAQYQPQPASSDGPAVNSTYKETIFNTEHKVIPLFAGAMVAVGLIGMLLGALMSRTSLDDGLLAFGSGILFLALAVLPTISNDYNLERLYQQLLVVISPAFIYGFLIIFKRWIKPKILIILMTLTVVGYLVGTTSFLDQFIFGISNINLINNGVNYDHYYTTQGEVSSLAWLQGVSGSERVNLDRYSILNAKAYTTIPPANLHEGLFPSEITSHAFVYASSANLNKNLTFDLYQNHIITYTFPRHYFTSVKNTVYSNQDSSIYK